MSNSKTVDELAAEIAELNGVQAPNPKIMLITKLIEVEGKLGDAEGKLESTRARLKDADECNRGLLEHVMQKELHETKAELLKTKAAFDTANEEKVELEETKAELLKTKAELLAANAARVEELKSLKEKLKKMKEVEEKLVSTAKALGRSGGG